MRFNTFFSEDQFRSDMLPDDWRSIHQLTLLERARINLIHGIRNAVAITIALAGIFWLIYWLAALPFAIDLHSLTIIIGASHGTGTKA